MQAIHPYMSRHTTRDAPRPITDIVLAADVAGLATRAGKLADLGVRLNRVLPSALAAQVRLANLREHQLVFLATSPAWATRLRYSQSLVLEAARQLGLDAQGIVVKVVPPAPADVAEPGAEPPSDTAVRHLALAARLLDRP